MTWMETHGRDGACGMVWGHVAGCGNIPTGIFFGYVDDTFFRVVIGGIAKFMLPSVGSYTPRRVCSVIT